jgi:hypothetical protein
MPSFTHRPGIAIAFALLGALEAGAERGWEIDERPAAAAECTPARVGADRRAETARIRACLDEVARPPRAEERFLYTYGHGAKMQEIRGASKKDFCVFEYTRQNTVEAAKHELALEQLNAIDPAKVADARRIAGEADDLLDLAQQAQDQGIKYSPLHAMNLAALDKVYPGFLEGIESDTTEELRALDGLGSPAARGAATGLRIALADTGRLYEKASASTGGKGVYFNNDATAKIAHFEGGALACAVTDRIRIVDIYDPATRNALIDAHVIVPDAAPGRSLLRPNTGHNLLVAPAEFEAAAIGFLFLFSAHGEAVYVDKCALDLAKVCRDVAVDDFRDCPAFEEFGRNLLGNPAFFSFIEAQGNFARAFFDVWNECVADDYQDEHICAGLAPRLPPHVRSYLQKNAKKDYQAAMKACGLKP